MAEQDEPEKGDEKHEQAGDECRVRRRRGAQAEGLEYEAGRKKSGEDQAAPQGLQGNPPKCAGKAEDGGGGGDPEAERDEQNRRGLPKAFFDDDETASPDEGDEQQSEIRPERFRNSHGSGHIIMKASPEVAAMQVVDVMWDRIWKFLIIGVGEAGDDRDVVRRLQDCLKDPESLRYKVRYG